jgi:hypothetical protein
MIGETYEILLDNQIKADKMGGTCGMHGEKREDRIGFCEET